MPPHSWQAPYGLLNENIRGDTSGSEIPQSAHASRSENSMGSPGLPASLTGSTCTIPSARRSAVSSESARRAEGVAHDEPVHDHLDRVLALPVELDLLAELADGAVHADARVPLALEVEEELLVLALAPADDRREHEQPRPRRLPEHAVHHLLDRLRRDDAVARRAVRHADPREEHAQVVVDLGDGADGRARVLRRRLLLDRDRRRQALDRVHLGLLHLLEKLPRVGGERLDVAALALGVDRVEGQRRFPGPREPRDDDELVARDLEVDVLQIVLAGTPDDDLVAGHVETLLCQPRVVRATRQARAVAKASGAATRAG